MANKITDGVGKKIVEALKQQSDVEIQQIVENPAPFSSDEIEYIEEETSAASPLDTIYPEPTVAPQPQPTPVYTEPVRPIVQPQVAFGASPITNDLSELDGCDVPQNVAVLKQLITQLPPGVNKHTGAQIIRQTMEALGISMKSVLQEAQMVQENLNSSAAQAQANITEYKHQIGVLENQILKTQKQTIALNDIISLFVQV